MCYAFTDSMLAQEEDSHASTLVPHINAAKPTAESAWKKQLAAKTERLSPDVTELSSRNSSPSTDKDDDSPTAERRGRKGRATTQETEGTASREPDAMQVGNASESEYEDSETRVVQKRGRSRGAKTAKGARGLSNTPQESFTIGSEDGDSDSPPVRKRQKQIKGGSAKVHGSGRISSKRGRKTSRASSSTEIEEVDAAPAEKKRKLDKAAGTKGKGSGKPRSFPPPSEQVLIRSDAEDGESSSSEGLVPSHPKQTKASKLKQEKTTKKKLADANKATYNAKLSEAVLKHKAELTALRTKHSELIKELRQKQDVELIANFATCKKRIGHYKTKAAEAEDGLKDAKAAFAQELKDVKAERVEYQKKLKAEQVEEIKSWKPEHSKTVKEKDAALKASQKQIDDLLAAQDRAQKRIERLTDVIADRDETLEKFRVAFRKQSNDVEELKTDLAHRRADVVRVEQEKSDLRSKHAAELRHQGQRWQVQFAKAEKFEQALVSVRRTNFVLGRGNDRMVGRIGELEAEVQRSGERLAGDGSVGAVEETEAGKDGTGTENETKKTEGEGDGDWKMADGVEIEAVDKLVEMEKVAADAEAVDLGDWSVLGGGEKSLPEGLGYAVGQVGEAIFLADWSSQTV